MQSASADFPIDGRAAMMIEVARLEAGGEAVEVAEAGRRAGDLDAGLVERRDPLEALLQQLVDVRELARDALLREVEDDLLGLVDEVAASRPGAPSRAARSRRRRGSARAASPSRGRSARSGPRSRVAGTSAASSWRRTRPPTSSSSPRSSSSSVSVIASTGSPCCVERERGAVDLRVRLAVEVARVEDLADGPDRARREHHRAEDGLLGLEVLGRHGARSRQGRRDGGQLCHR